MPPFSTHVPPQSLCLLRTSALGDVTHVVPIVRTLQADWPQLRLNWIVGKREHKGVGDLPGGEVGVVERAAGGGGIDDLAVLRHGGMGRVFTRPYAPSTLGSFLRAFTFGHVRQLDAVASRFLLKLAGLTPLRGNSASYPVAGPEVDGGAQRPAPAGTARTCPGCGGALPSVGGAWSCEPGWASHSMTTG